MIDLITHPREQHARVGHPIHRGSFRVPVWEEGGAPGGAVNMDWLFPPYTMKRTRVRRFGEPDENDHSASAPREKHAECGTHGGVMRTKSKP